jgi:hypothetical protein
MKFDDAWTWAGEPRGETLAPLPGKGTLQLPRLPAAGPCSAKQASASSAPCLRSDADSVLRLTNIAPAPAHTSPSGQDGTRPRRHTRLHRTRQALDQAALIARCAPACLRGRIGPPHPGGFGNWFGLLERQVATQTYLLERILGWGGNGARQVTKLLIWRKRLSWLIQLR